MSTERIYIDMEDGVRLAATVYFPQSEGPWPALLEAYPYRKDDLLTESAFYDRLCAEGDYAICRVDVRGTGSSEGIAVDEYPAREQQDLCRVIEWLAGREWSTGSVGMFGTSYGGFNSLQVAMRRPPALKAIVPIYATDDRYTDDVHYGGGIRRALDFVDYPLMMVAMNALPPVPRLAGPQWRDHWRERLDNLQPWLLRWLAEQNDGPYWRHGSLRPHYEQIEAATMIVAGWADGYHNMAFRTFERLVCPKRLLIGPWSHLSPDTSIPGPRIDFIPELIRWWDRWLRNAGDDDGEPPISLFVRRSTRPEPDLDEVRGEWRYENAWPLERSHVLSLPLDGDDPDGRDKVDSLVVRGDVGASGSIWCAAQLPFGPPMDQRPDEAFSLVYDWPVLEADLEILGYPKVEATIRCSAPVAFLSAKICDVFEDGTSALVSRGILNLTHRRSHGEPEPLGPEKTYEVTVDLDVTSWVFCKGHRVRLDLAGADWPSTWPPPHAAELEVMRSGTALLLPVVRGPSPIKRVPDYAPSSEAPDSSSDGVLWRFQHDVLERSSRVVIEQHSDWEFAPMDVRIGNHRSGETGVSTEDPGTAWAEGRAAYTLQWPEVTASTEARVSLRSDSHSYHLDLDLVVYEDGAAILERRWSESYPRDLQ